MKCNIVPMGKWSRLTYDVKFVNVENERVFAKISAPEVYCNSIDCIYEKHYPFVFEKINSNLLLHTLNSPDFGELHKNKSIAEYKRKKLKHARLGILKSTSDIDEKNVYKVKRKIFPTPLPNFTNREENMSAMVDALLLDIYGPVSDKGHSESDSTFSSTYPGNPHVRRFRLLLKSVRELRIVFGNLREHINHVGSLLIRQLRRRDYLLAKRDKYNDVITAHLQALSNKRSK